MKKTYIGVIAVLLSFAVLFTSGVLYASVRADESGAAEESESVSTPVTETDGTTKTEESEKTDRPETEKETEAETGAPAVPSDYDVFFLSGGLPSLNLLSTESGPSAKMMIGRGVYLCELRKEGKKLSRSILLKATDGAATFSVVGNELTVKGSAGDICDATTMGDDFCTVRLDGGYFTSLPGKFSGAEIDTFLFSFGERVRVRSALSSDKTFEGWKSSSPEITFSDAKQTTVDFILPRAAGKSVTLTATYTSVHTLKELLEIAQGATLELEENYVLTEALVISDGRHEINLGGHTITCQTDSVFKVTGGTLILSGTGSVKSGKAQGIRVDGGTLSLDGPDVSAADYAVYCVDGAVTVNAGKLTAKTAALSLRSVDCSAVISGGTLTATGTSGTALDMQGGRANVSGGTFSGTKAIAAAADCVCSVSAGTFSTDVTKYLAPGSTLSRGATGYVVKKESNKYTVTVFSGKGGGSYAPGDKVTLTADTDTSVSSFDEWTVLSGTLKLANKRSRTITFTMPECDVAIKANYIIGGDVSMGEIDTERQPESGDTVYETEIVTDKNGESHIVPRETEPAISDKDAAKGMRLIALTATLAVLLIIAIAVSAILLVRRYRLDRAAATKEMIRKKEKISAGLMDELAAQLSEMENVHRKDNNRNGR